MNRFLLITILSIFSGVTNAQTYNFILNADVKKEYRNFKDLNKKTQTNYNYGDVFSEQTENYFDFEDIDSTETDTTEILKVGQVHYKIGDKIKITGLKHSVIYNRESSKYKDLYYIFADGNNLLVNKDIISSIIFKISSVQDLWNAHIIKDVIPNIQKKGTQYDLRSDMEDDALEYISKIESYGLKFYDPFLENYIYGLISKIAPIDIIDGRPVNVNILIEKNPVLNAAMYPNGTMIISTGLLSALHSEDELVAILAHEIAHFVLDHSITNVNAAITRKKRAEFWSAIATGITAVAEGVVSSKTNGSYIPGAATASMAIASTAIASQIIDRLGMKYNHDQETEADDIAVKVLELLHYDKNALATAFNRIQNQLSYERSNAIYFDSYTHPALIKRIERLGWPKELVQMKYEKMVSFAITCSAQMKYEDRRFRQVIPLIDQNINNHVATATDYTLKAKCMLKLYNDEKSNAQIKFLLEQAKKAVPGTSLTYKPEILLALRMGNKQEASKLLDEYDSILNKINIVNANIYDELYWVNDMKVKIAGL